MLTNLKPTSRLSTETREFILAEGQKVAPQRRFAFYRWALRIAKS